ncbi:Diaminopimelate epimerase-like protein [Meredithblackwellia eburnea MCA 4105]
MSTTLKYLGIDCFTTEKYTGNPAAVFQLPAKSPLMKETAFLQRLAIELCLPASAFVMPLEDSTDINPHYDIRFFSTRREIPLCGHATMASSHALFSTAHKSATIITFETSLGHGSLLAVRESAESKRITLDFPSDEGILDKVEKTEEKYLKALELFEQATALSQEKVVDVAYSSRGCLIEITRDVDLKELNVQAKILGPLSPFVVLSQLSPLGSNYDVYSRVFTAAVGQDEDPVCGSAHCFIGPRWLGTAARSTLEKSHFTAQPDQNELKARQVSERGGDLDISWDPVGHRVRLTGEAVTMSSGEVYA